MKLKNHVWRFSRRSKIANFCKNAEKVEALLNVIITVHSSKIYIYMDKGIANLPFSSHWLSVVFFLLHWSRKGKFLSTHRSCKVHKKNVMRI